MKEVTIRQGDTWSYTSTVTLTGTDGSPVSAVGWTVTSTLMDSNKKLLQFTTGWLDESLGLMYHKATSAATNKLPVGTFTFNLRFVTPNGEVISSDDIQLVVERRIT